MAEPSPPNRAFLPALLIAILAAAAIWGGVTLIMMAPTPINDWFGLAPLLIGPGLLCLLIGAVLIVLCVAIARSDDKGEPRG
jgi:hypothetical protein